MKKEWRCEIVCGRPSFSLQRERYGTAISALFSRSARLRTNTTAVATAAARPGGLALMRPPIHDRQPLAIGIAEDAAVPREIRCGNAFPDQPRMQMEHVQQHHDTGNAVC